MQAAFVIGVHETHDKVVPKEILKYFGISIFYKEIDNWSSSITASIASAAGLQWVQRSNTVVYGIEISPNSPDDNINKLIAEHTVNSFVDFMYTFYKLEYEHYLEILCIKTKNELMHIRQQLGTLPENVNHLEFNITIYLERGTPSKITSDLKDSLSIEIAKAGFKLNMACLCMEPSDLDQGFAKIYFNINTSHDIRTWIHAMKRKAKRKFHCIDSFKAEENIKEVF